MPRPFKQKQERSREDDDAASSSKRPKHYKTPSSDHFDTIDLTTPEPVFEDVLTNKQQNCHNVIDTIDLAQSDHEPGMKANPLYHCITPLTRPQLLGSLKGGIALTSRMMDTSLNSSPTQRESCK